MSKADIFKTLDGIFGVKRAYRTKADPGECAYCDHEREAGNGFHPPHDPSVNCQSGGRAHCSCDVCF